MWGCGVVDFGGRGRLLCEQQYGTEVGKSEWGVLGEERGAVRGNLTPRGA